MAAKQYDFTIEQGSSFTFEYTYLDESNNPIDLTDYCARLIWTTNNGSINQYLTTNNDPSLYDFSIVAPSGVLTLKIPATITNDFEFLSANYDLEIESNNDFYSGGGNLIERILYGTVTIDKRHSGTTTLLDCQ